MSRMRLKPGYRYYLCYLVLLGFFTTMFFTQMLHQQNLKLTDNKKAALSSKSMPADEETSTLMLLKEFISSTTETEAPTVPSTSVSPTTKLGTVKNEETTISSTTKLKISNRIENTTSSTTILTTIKPDKTVTTTEKPTSVTTKKSKPKKTQKGKKKPKPKKPPKKKKDDFLKSLRNPKLYQEIVNPHEMDFIVEHKDFCSRHPNLYILTVVHSAPHNFFNRKYIRETWGNKSLYRELNVTTLFFLGVPSDPNVMKQVMAESEQYKDIIIQDYVDSYRNLTYKAMSWLEWINNNCQTVPYIMKADDDTFLNFFRLTKLLQNFDKKERKNHPKVVMCQKRSQANVLRLKTKWKVSMQEYSDDLYPPHCPGYAIILGREVIPLLHNASYYVPYYWIDDVYFSGMLTAKASIDIINISNRYAPISNQKKLLSGSALFTYGKVTDAKLRKYWDVARARYYNRSFIVKKVKKL